MYYPVVATIEYNRQDIIMISFIFAVIKLLLSGILGGIAGYSREYPDRKPGIQLLILVSLGTTALTIGALRLGHIADVGDPGNAAAGIIAGIAILGAIYAFKTPDSEYALTAAVIIWVTGAVGFLVGTGQIFVAMILTGILYYIIHYLPDLLYKEIQSLETDHTHEE